MRGEFGGIGGGIELFTDMFGLYIGWFDGYGWYTPGLLSA